MDTGRGYFEKYPSVEEAMAAKTKAFRQLEKSGDVKTPKPGGIFKVGEKITIKESIFEIVEIRPKGMNLKLLKRGL